MGLKAEQKDYYESELQRRVLFIPNLSLFLSKLNDQVLKLPHEILDPSSNVPSGCTENDIINSIDRGVEIVYVMVAPARALLSTEEGKLVVFDPKEIAGWDKLTIFQKAMKKLEWIYLLLEEADWLNDRLISETLPDNEDVYDLGGKIDDKTEDAGTLPPSVIPPDGKTLGEMEKENP